MIYFNNTIYDVYFFGYKIYNRTFFKFDDIETFEKLKKMDKHIKNIIDNIFSKAIGNDNSFIEFPKKYTNIIILSLDDNIIINNNFIELKDFNSINKKFTVNDLIIVKNTINIDEKVIQEK